MKLTSWLVVLLLGVSLAGCNTVEGIGKDLSKLGDKIEKTADENK
jgi:predicted small secreted protein